MNATYKGAISKDSLLSLITFVQAINITLVLPKDAIFRVQFFLAVFEELHNMWDLDSKMFLMVSYI